MIRFESISKKFRGRPAVAGVSFEVARGEIFGLLGQVVIYNQLNIFYINSSAGNVCCNQNSIFSIFKTFQSFFSLILRSV